MVRDVSPEREVEVGQTADLDVVTLVAARALLDDVFGAEMTDHAWEHAQGGVHALIWDAGQLIGHGAVVARQLRHRRRLLRAGYIEAVGVRVDARRRGHGAAIMEVLERIVRDAYDLGAVGASQAGASFYASRGWTRWQGRTWARTRTGLIRTAEDDEDVYVLEVGAALDLSGDLTCGWRDGDIW